MRCWWEAPGGRLPPGAGAVRNSSSYPFLQALSIVRALHSPDRQAHPRTQHYGIWINEDHCFAIASASLGTLLASAIVTCLDEITAPITMGVWAGNRGRPGPTRHKKGKQGHGNSVLFTIFFLFLALCLHEERMRAMDLSSPDFAADPIRPPARNEAAPPVAIRPVAVPPAVRIPSVPHVDRIAKPVVPVIPLSDPITKPIAQDIPHVDRITQPDLTDPNPGRTAAEALRPHNSAPMAKPHHMLSLRQQLQFTMNTRLNFMHFHKTGGVSFKIALFSFFSKKKKRNGDKVRVRDACYELISNGKSHWRCDWTPLWKMTAKERSEFDVFFGHQYREHGVDHFLKGHDVRTFTVMRHPFARKVSFFHHFFVRALGRKENSVPFEELRDFLLYEKIPQGTQAGWDIGPNYMAGRLLSTDKLDFVGNDRRRHFEVKPQDEKEVIEGCQKIIDSYVFVGLQSESEASQCMLKNTVMAFNEALGIDNSNIERLAEHIPHTNSGSYKLSSGQAWAKLTAEERKIFNHAERVDLAIYYEGERQFKKQVRFFGCEHLVKKVQLQAA